MIRFAVAGVVLGEQREVRVPLGLSLPVVADVDLAAENRLDSVLSGLPVELDGPGERAMIGEPDGGHLELSGASREGGNPAGPIEDGVLGVDVKVDERRFRHGKSILVLAQDRTQRRPSPAAFGPCRPVHAGPFQDAAATNDAVPGMRSGFGRRTVVAFVPGLLRRPAPRAAPRSGPPARARARRVD